jgi:hypothetical protein
MIFDDDPESKLSQMGGPDFFQIVKESNCQVAIGNQLFKIRDISGPKLKGSMKIFKFSTDHCSLFTTLTEQLQAFLICSEHSG